MNEYSFIKYVAIHPLNSAGNGMAGGPLEKTARRIKEEGLWLERSSRQR